MYSFQRQTVLFRLSKSDSEVRKILDALPTKELGILEHHPDLQDRIHEIVNMPVGDLTDALTKNFDLIVSQYGTGEVMIDIEKLEDAVPDWLDTRHFGWYILTSELIEFCRDFLMGEVRTNIYIRHLEYKQSLEDTQTRLLGPGYGNYP